ncbi:33 kDa chaperonin [Rubritalea halochordaticola]|uniref:33 kDa chaperonin n=2 Tax=Rubritalea halochordaticola TaxID=714537 RepID=A0ABP9UZ53_9BACT
MGFRPARFPTFSHEDVGNFSLPDRRDTPLYPRTGNTGSSLLQRKVLFIPPQTRHTPAQQALILDHYKPMEAVEEFTKIESIFVRHRNALLVRGQFTPIFTDYYLHLMDLKLRHKEDLDQKLKDLLALLTLHMTARPWAETIAWTVNLRAPRVNFFVTGGSTQENITGNLFTENIKETDRNILYSQTIVPSSEGRKSTVELDSNDPFEWLETYYTQSEQRPARAFQLKDENYAIIAAQPDCDYEWLESLNAEDVEKIMETEETKVLETRKFRFFCGCSVEKILPALAAYKNNKEALFHGDPAIEVSCPRCAAKYIVTPDML